MPGGEVRFPRAGEVWPEPGKMEGITDLGVNRQGDEGGAGERVCQQRSQPVARQRAGHVMDTRAPPLAEHGAG